MVWVLKDVLCDVLNRTPPSQGQSFTPTGNQYNSGLHLNFLDLRWKNSTTLLSNATLENFHLKEKLYPLTCPSWMTLANERKQKRSHSKNVGLVSRLSRGVTACITTKKACALIDRNNGHWFSLALVIFLHLNLFFLFAEFKFKSINVTNK